MRTPGHWADLELIQFEFENQKRLEVEKLQVNAGRCTFGSKHARLLSSSPRLLFDRAVSWQLIAELEASLEQAGGDAVEVCKGPGASTKRAADVYRALAAQVHDAFVHSRTRVCGNPS